MLRNHSIGVILPAYQSAPYIATALESILGQTILPCEVLVSDGGSQDGTDNIVRSIAAIAPIPIRLVRNNLSSGITQNYIHALQELSPCDYVAVADHDDAWLPRRLQVLQDAFRQNPGATLVCCDSLIADAELSPTGETVRGGLAKSKQLCRQHLRRGSFSSFLKGGLPCLAHTLAFSFEIRSALLKKPSTIPDWYFEEWLTSIAACFGDLVLIPDALTLYRQHPQQATHSLRPHVKQTTIVSKANSPVYTCESRLKKLIFCRSILENTAFSPRVRSDIAAKLIKLNEACQFHKSRMEIYNSTKRLHARLSLVIRLWLARHYHRYASGAWSAGSDVLAILKTLVYINNPQRR
jgi:glycosyltransferase involved in cell wall biosynthesis